MNTPEPTISRIITGIPIWLLREYLVDLGAEEMANGDLRADVWAARLTQVEDRAVGSLRIGQVRLEIWSHPERLASLVAVLEKRMMRGGG